MRAFLRAIAATALAVALAACAGLLAPPGTGSGPTGEAPGASESFLGSARVLLAPDLRPSRLVPADRQAREAGRTAQAIVKPYTVASIDRLDVVPYVQVSQGVFRALEAATGTATDSADPAKILRVTQASPSIDLARTIAIDRLKGDTTYRFYARAYDGSGSLISSDDASSSVTLAVARDDRPAFGTLPIKLLDRTFAATIAVALTATGSAAALSAIALDLYSVTGGVETLATSSVAALSGGAPPATASFGNLDPVTLYRVKATARDGGSTVLATGSVDVQVGYDTAPALVPLTLTVPVTQLVVAGVPTAADNGSFSAQAATYPGTVFANLGTSSRRCAFSPSGTWQGCNGCAAMTPGGVGGNGGVTGGSIGALIIQKGDGSYMHIDAGPTSYSLAPGEQVRFLMNDSAGGFADNVGSLTVSWSCDLKYGGHRVFDENGNMRVGNGNNVAFVAWVSPAGALVNANYGDGRSTISTVIDPASNRSYTTAPTSNKLTKNDLIGNFITQFTLPTSSAHSLTLDRNGFLYASAYFEGQVYRVDSSSGTVTTLASGLANPWGLSVDLAGTVVGISSTAARLYRISAAGVVTTVALPEVLGAGGATYDAEGNVYAAGNNTTKVYKITPGNVISVFATLPNVGGPIVTDAAGNFFVASYAGSGRISKVTPAGVAASFIDLTATGRTSPSF
jgi:sugar lactone lactonase YvrE